MDTLGGVSQDFILGETGELEPHYWNTKISNIFGDAVPVFKYDEEEEAEQSAETAEGAEGSEEAATEEEPPPPPKAGYDGSTGIRFGVRLCYIPPTDFNPLLNYGDTVPNKSFLFKEPFRGNPPDHNATKILPLVSYERDILDRNILDLNLEDDNFGEDLGCYIEALMDSPEMDLIFGYCAPIKRASSMLSLYSHYGFIASVAEHPQERDTLNGDAPTEYWKSRVLAGTKKSLRRLFIANYSSAQFLSEKVGSQKDGYKINFPKLWFRLFMILINPFAFLAGLGVGWGGWKKGKQIVYRPYDMYCEPEGGDDGVD